MREHLVFFKNGRSVTLRSDKQSVLNRLADRLEALVEASGEVVLSSFRWDLEEPDPTLDLSDPYLGLTSEFLEVIEEICPTRQHWLQLYAALLTEIADLESEVGRRLVALSDNLWMKTGYDDLWVWHKAFPPLDGGGSSQARVFHQFFRSRYSGRRFKTCFEWCAGPGFLGFSLLWGGWCEELVLADVNPDVAPGIERTIRENHLEGRVRYYLSDNLKAVPEDERFDLVIGNPPWAYREIPGLPNPLIPNDPRWRIHRAFFAQLEPYLVSGALVCVSAYEPFKAVAYIEEQAEPWDIRPRPPIEDFRRFIEEGGLALEGVYRPAADPQISFGKGMSLFIIRNEPPESEPVDLDLIGLGGTKQLSDSQPHPFDLTLVREVNLEQLTRHSTQLEAVRYGVYLNLKDRHLCDVLGALFRRPQDVPSATIEAALGIPAAIVEAFVDWNDPSGFAYLPPVEGMKLQPESCRQSVNRLRLQVGQDAPVCVALKMLRELLRALAGEVNFEVMVKPGFDEEATRRVLQRLEGYTSARVNFWEHGHQTLFAQDNGRLARLSDGSPVLLVPGALGGHRTADALTNAPIPLVHSRLHWEGGNVLCDGHRVFVGANSVAATMRNLGLTREQVVKAFSLEMGYEAVVLGDVEAALAKAIQGERGLAVPHAVDGGQADFHIDLDCCLLGPSEGRYQVALADPESGLNFLHEVLAQERLFQGHFLTAPQAKELFKRALERSVVRRVPLLAQYESAFREAGYEVCRVPDIRLVSDENYLARVNLQFGYCNALTLSRRGTPTVCLLPCGMAELEAEVERLYNTRGVEVLWVGDPGTSEELLSMRGGLHCFCSIFDLGAGSGHG